MLRFAPRYGMISPCLRRPAGRPAHAANDNSGWATLNQANGTAHASPSQMMAARVADHLADDALVAQALRLFASHGHAAAGQAAAAAKGAAVKGDREGAARWTRVCYTLDRRKGRALERELTTPA